MSNARSVRRFVSGILLLVLSVGAGQAFAQPATGGDSSGESQQSWRPQEPEPKDFDWIMLVSGEWLKGELISLYSDVVEFDSDELDELSLDWEDVLVVKTHRPYEVLFVDRSKYVGKLLVRDGQIHVLESSAGARSRETVLSIANTRGDFLSIWDGNISLAVDFRDGNTQRKDYTARIDTQRRTSETRFKLNYLYTFSKVENNTVEDSERLTTSMDLFLSDRWFIRPIQFEYYADEFQNIDERYTATSQIGYYLIDTSRTTWDVFAGPGYQVTHYVTVEPGRGEKEETAVGVVGTSLDIELTNDIDYDFNYEGQWVSDDAGGFNHHLDTGLSIEFLGDFDLDIRFILDRVEKPVPKADGSVPSRNDTSLHVGLSYEF